MTQVAEPITIQPIDWPIIVPNSKYHRARVLTPAITWRLFNPGPSLARFNAAGVDLLIATFGRERCESGALGLQIRRGMGADDGKFAIEAADYQRGLNVKLSGVSKMAAPARASWHFSATVLSGICPKQGNSRLERVGDLLIACAVGWEVDTVFHKKPPVPGRRPGRPKAEPSLLDNGSQV